jgi:hypothetical protein
MVAQAGRRLNPALRRHLREWRLRDPDEVRVRVAEVTALAPDPVPDWRICDRLTAEDEQALAASFRAGTAKHQLAERYGISLSSVKRLLRKHNVRRDRSA